MKRVLSLVLALALVLGSIPAGFAADTQTAGEILKGYGVLSGDANGNLNETQTIDRATMYTVLIKLLGKDAEAKAYTVPSTFSDDNNSWAANYIAFAEKEGLTKGVGNGLFSPEGKVTLQQMATIMLRALGYEADYNTAIADATAQGLLKSVVESENNGIVVKSDVYTSMLNTLSAPVKDSTTLLGNVLKIAGFAPVNAGPAVVSKVDVASVKTIKVTFANAIADTTKAVFTVKRSSTVVAVTATWNEAKTEATLTSASNFAEASYDVNVAYDTKDLGTKSVVFTAQKVAKIEITSSSVAVDMTANNANKGYVTYKVFDQYGVDITANYLANNMTFTAGTGTAAGKNGLITITPGTTPLLQFQNISIVIYDSTSAVSMTKALPVSTSVGTLSDFALGSADALKLVEGDTATVFYLPYTAKDMSGNETKNYELVKSGLILTNDSLVVSLTSNVSAKIVKDPSNTKNAAIEVRAISNATALSMDMPVTITAMTYTGKSTSVQTTMAKAKALSTVVLLAPAETVAVGETPEIAYEAFDQLGNKVTKYSDINGKVTATGFTISEKTDGTAKFTMTAVTSKSIANLSAVVPATGKMSNLTINVQDAVEPASITVDRDVLVQAMEEGANQNIDFGEDAGGITVFDQYDREIDADDLAAEFAAVTLTDGTVRTYSVVVDNEQASSPDVALSLNGAANANTVTMTAGSDIVTLKAAATAGTTAVGAAETVTFKLQRTDVKSGVTTNSAVDTASVSLAVIDTLDITAYTLDAVSSAIYTSVVDNGAAVARDTRYDANPSVYGKTAAGTKVLLAGTPIVGASLSNTDDFVFGFGFAGSATSAAAGYSDVIVNATKLADAAKTAAETVLTVNILHNNAMHALTTTIKSTTAVPVAKDITTTGTTNDAVTITKNTLNGKYIVDYTSTGTATTAVTNIAGDAFKFRIVDQYGSRAMAFAQFKVVKVANGGVASDISITADGQITEKAGGATAGQYWISAITNNGLVKTIKVTIQ